MTKAPKQVWEIPPEELHAICRRRYTYFDELPKPVRDAIRNTKWGSHPKHMEDYYFMLKSKHKTVDEVVALVWEMDELDTEAMYRRGTLKRMSGDGPTETR